MAGGAPAKTTCAEVAMAASRRGAKTRMIADRDDGSYRQAGNMTD